MKIEDKRPNKETTANQMKAGEMCITRDGSIVYKTPPGKKYIPASQLNPKQTAITDSGAIVYKTPKLQIYGDKSVLLILGSIWENSFQVGDYWEEDSFPYIMVNPIKAKLVIKDIPTHQNKYDFWG
jgi:hypothetical protein